MDIDFHAYLWHLDVLDSDSVEVGQRSDPECLIAASCEPADGGSLAAAAEKVRETWAAKLRYGYYEAHTLRIEADRAVLDAVTQIAPRGLFVTAQITIRAARTGE